LADLGIAGEKPGKFFRSFFPLREGGIDLDGVKRHLSAHHSHNDERIFIVFLHQGFAHGDGVGLGDRRTRSEHKKAAASATLAARFINIFLGLTRGAPYKCLNCNDYSGHTVSHPLFTNS